MTGSNIFIFDGINFLFMGNFFKTFFASLLSLVVFSLLILLVMVIFVGGLTKKVKPRVKEKTVLVIDLGHHYKEQQQDNPLAFFTSEGEENTPGLYDVVRLLQKAKSDKRVTGIYLKTKGNPNGFAACNELRTALIGF